MNVLQPEGLCTDGILADDKFSESAFKPSNAYGASLNYRFHNGLFVGLRAEQFRRALKESGDALGNLKVQPALFVLGYQGKPTKGRSLTGHVQLGGGVGKTQFEKGPAIDELEQIYRGAQLVVRTENAPVFEMGRRSRLFRVTAREPRVRSGLRSATGPFRSRRSTSSSPATDRCWAGSGSGCGRVRAADRVPAAAWARAPGVVCFRCRATGPSGTLKGPGRGGAFEMPK